MFLYKKVFLLKLLKAFLLYVVVRVSGRKCSINVVMGVVCRPPKSSKFFFKCLKMP